MKSTFRNALAHATVALACCAALALPHIARADTYTQTRYPLVLVHGLLGFGAIGPLDYFYGVPQALQSGGATVYVAQVSAANSHEVRGEQLLAELKRLKATYGYERFNLIGHSQGGPTARYIAAVAPELVASITTVGAPHAGSAVADDIAAGTSATGTTPFVAAIVDAAAQLISVLSGQPGLPQMSSAALDSLSTAGSARFNAKYPLGMPGSACGQGVATAQGMRFYSVGGTAVLTHPLDVSDVLLGLGATSFKGAPNDGLVGRCSSHFGTVLRDDYPWNHLDEVNQAFGLRGGFAPDPVAFYRTQANRLKTAGL